MARPDPTEQALLRLELRRFSTRCDELHAMIERADSMREIARLANVAIPYRLAGEYAALDQQRRVQHAAEERIRDLVRQMIDSYQRADESEFKLKVAKKFQEEINHLVGPLAPLRAWALNRWALAEQNR